ncbi:bacillithiol biosynthesis cysteine-adding enzyme BshC [Patiriisocius marinus]|uniref:Putative cysteine ligase BshC n=1 Tax=Patiriisocius marinus TaxID=1397112 RepID=A0A5J4INI5_9FLAO|nr:bacillithiol biosynthesis cysteine-adding enzyme BshC [Patiriisocius marinus]GER58959.1 putative cysteine ligase BshC [Patiriisocius marinus]
MVKTTIPYKDTGYFSQTMCDYLAEAQSLKPFYNRFPKLENFKAQLKEKSASFTLDTRQVLAKQLQQQYDGFNISEATQSNILALKTDKTFTVTTGHQLNLFTGPLYFLFKIVSVINLAKQLKKAHPEYTFIPVYWMATEDHDFDEINYFNFKGNKIQWNREDGGAVGEFSTEGIDQVLSIFKHKLGKTDNAKKLVTLFEEAYVKHSNLADATRFLGNELFKEDGLVIVDGNDVGLKTLFAPFVKKELLDQISHKEITTTTKRLIDAGYNEQVHPREVNLFYIIEGIRERIIKKEDVFHVNDTNISLTETEILETLEKHPERFSPNALLRPLYQEVILPNLCYTGGGGELAYWLQLKDYFKCVAVPFPMLLLRNSALIYEERNNQKIEKLDLTIKELFKKQNDLKTYFTKSLSDISIDFSEQKKLLASQFKDLYEIAKKTDASFLGAVAAQEKKQTNGLAHLEKRLLKAQKRKYQDQLTRLIEIQSEIFPNNSLQERQANFSEFYLLFGDVLLTTLKRELDPLLPEFTAIAL